MCGRKCLYRAVLLSAVLLPLVVMAQPAGKRGFNPDISLILDGRVSSYSNDSPYALPGFMLGEEAGRGENGFQVGHNELAMSANVDDRFFGKLTVAIADHEGATEVELEEAFVETRGLGHGITVRAGRFFSGIGYLNSRHGHSWDFADAPLIYQGLFGNQIIDDGVQLNWVAPTDLYLQIGIEATRGERFPAGGAANDGKGATAMFVRLGGDVDDSHAWQLGLSHWRADVSGREGAAAASAAPGETPDFTGKSRVSGIDFVWKWSPHGNPTQRNLKIQAEYFVRDEDGNLTIEGSSPLESGTYIGDQSGWYLQTVYQFMPRWRVGIRHDQLSSDNTGSNAVVLAKAGVASGGHDPSRDTVMIDYSRSEYSRIRLQYARDESYADSDNIVTVQFVMSLGSHGAHRF